MPDDIHECTATDWCEEEVADFYCSNCDLYMCLECAGTVWSGGCDYCADPEYYCINCDEELDWF